MEIISGDAAYRITEEFRQDALNKVINEYTEIFNKEISSAALRGSDICLVGWKDLGITSHPSDEDFYNLAAFALRRGGTPARTKTPRLLTQA